MPNLRTTLLRRTVLAGTILTVAGAGAGGAYMHLTASASPAPSAAGAAPATTTTHHHHHGRHGLLRGLVRATAKDTHQTEAQVLAQLRAGRTINQIAGAQAATVKQDVLAQLKTRLDRAVSHGRIDAARETALLSRAGKRLDTLMSRDLAAALQHRADAGEPAAPAKPTSTSPAAAV